MTIASDLAAAQAMLTVDAALLRAIVQGPASGTGSTVDIGGGVMVRTLARVAAEASGPYVRTDGAAAMAGNLKMSGTVAGNIRSVHFQTSGSDRWVVGPSFDAEGGANAGSNFNILRFDDAGAFIGTPFAIDRATGAVHLENYLTVAGNLAAGALGVTGQITLAGGQGVFNATNSSGLNFGGDTAWNLGARYTAYSRAGGNYHEWVLDGAALGMRLNSTGLAIGATPSQRFQTYDNANATTYWLHENVNTGGNVACSYRQTVGSKYTHLTTVYVGGFTQMAGFNIGTLYIDYDGHYIRKSDGTTILTMDIGAIKPGATNTVDNGGASNAWKNGWIVNAWTVTSGETAKANIGGPTDEERRVAARLSKLRKLYQLESAIEEKGKAAFDGLTPEQQAGTDPRTLGVHLARWHSGIVYEDAWAAFEAEGVDPNKYGIFVEDDEEETYQETITLTRDVIEEIDDQRERVEFVDGVAVVKMETFKRRVPKGEMVKAVDAEGKPIPIDGGEEPTGLLDADGNPIMRRRTVPRMIFKPETEEYEALGPVQTRKTGRKVRGIRYGELEAFIGFALAGGA